MTDPVIADFLDRFGAVCGTRYVIEGRIGSGGMAHVYRAADVKHARTVAVKFLKPETATDVGAERFLREIRIAAQLQHPNILPVFDSGNADGVIFYVMPYVDGDTLRSRLRREGVLEFGEALRITSEIGDALAFAHRRGIVHRDVKPENVLFSSGHAMVADFGIARGLDWAGTERLTQTGFGLGTPDYISPEQALGERVADPRSDIYSLACVLYEMLAGTPPFGSGTVMATLVRKMTEPAPRLSSCGELSIPAHVEEAIDRALSREPDSRYSSVEEFLRALGDVERPSSAARAGPPRQAATPSIAVLPLANYEADAENEFLSDGITEELIHALAKVDGLRVVARTSAFAFKGRTDDIRAIGRQLQVGTVLEGSLRRSGSRLRITVQLVDVATGFQRWTERYDRALTDVFDVQEEIARSIVDALRLRLLTPGASLVESRTNNAAYERYLAARYEWNRRTNAGLDRSLTLLQEALELDAAFVPALAALAEVHVTRAIYGIAVPDVEMPSARRAAERALVREPRHEGALAARACVRALFDWKWPDAEVDFRRAIESNGQMPTPAQWYATNFLVPLGRFSEGREQLARARELDPLSPVVALSDGVARYYERDFDGAIVRLGAIVEGDPRFGMAHYFLGCARREVGDAAAALAHLRDAAGLMGESAEVTAASGVTLARVDERRAREALASLEQRARADYVSPVLLAQVHTALGEHERALDALDAARRARATDLAWIAVRPVFDPLRGESRFARLLIGLGLSAVAPG